MTDKEQGKPTSRSFMSTMIAIAWAAIGLRRKKDFDDDVAGGMNPVFVIIAALIGTAIFIGALVTAVNVAVS
jgi:hypothetical protein